MEVSIEKPHLSSAHKAKNILIRHSCSKEVTTNSNYQHPEASYILKYSPKYYKSLTLETTRQSSLLSKAKKIKKLKTFTGLFRHHLPQKLWFNLLASNRKEIEAIPQICSVKQRVKLSKDSRKRLAVEKIRFFPNMARVLLTEWRVPFMEDDSNNLLSVKEHFVKYVWSMRKLKNLKIKMLVKNETYAMATWVLEKLNGMNRFLEMLDTFILDVKADDVSIQDVFQNKNVLSHLTGLTLSGAFEPIFAQIPRVCKNLKSLSLDFSKGVDETSGLPNLLASLHDLSQLKSLHIAWSKDSIHFWRQFKPQPSLRHLNFEFNALNLINEELAEKMGSKNGFKIDPLWSREEPMPVKPKSDVVDHWEDINELDFLKFKVSCETAQEILFMRQFLTMILKKVRKVRSLKIIIGGRKISGLKYEVFSVEEVPHLYESLERFEQLLLIGFDNIYSAFDLKTLRPFRNLRVANFGGVFAFSENIEDIVELLEANQKKGEHSELKISVSGDNLRSTLEKIEKVKRRDSNLQMRIEFISESENLIEALERMCNDIQSAKPIKGLVICLDLDNYRDFSELPTEGLKEVLKKYLNLRNLVVRAETFEESLEYIKIDGERMQMFIDN